MVNSIDIRERSRLIRSRKKSRHLFVLLAFLFFEYVRLQDSYLSFLGPLKIPALLNMYLLVVVFIYLKDLPKDRLIYLILAFWGLMVIHVPFATNNFHAFKATENMFLTMVAVLATTILINTQEMLKRLFEAMVYIVLLVSIWVILNGGKGPGGTVADENDVCLFLVCGFPFCWYYSKLNREKKLKRWIAVGTSFIAIVAIVFTSSRGGFLGLVAVFGMLLLFSGKPARNIFLSLIVATALGGIALNFVPQNYVSEIKTIADKEDGTRNLRLLHWTTAWEMFKDHPFVGVGPDNYPWNSGSYLDLSPFFVEGDRSRQGRKSHSVYFTLIPEMGILGIIIYFTLVFTFYKRGSLIRQHYRIDIQNNNRSQLGQRKNEQLIELLFYSYSALLVSMTGFLVSGAFISVLYYPVFWNLIGFSVAIWWIFQKIEFSPSSIENRINALARQ